MENYPKSETAAYGETVFAKKDNVDESPLTGTTRNETSRMNNGAWVN